MPGPGAMDLIERIFPYRMRPAQEPIVRAAAERGEKGGCLLLDAATGTGKTVSVLAPVLAHAEAADHRVLYLVRTHSQGAQVIAEAKAIARRRGSPILATTLEGRQGRCLLLEDVAEMEGGTAEEFGRLCGDRKRATERLLDPEAVPSPLAPPHPPSGAPADRAPTRTVDLPDLEGCPYYAKLLGSDLVHLEQKIAEESPHAGQFSQWSREQAICPYELSKRLCRRARLVVAPYVFFFHPHIRRSLLDWMGVPLSQVDLVVDEAHNLPEALREMGSLPLGEETLRRARQEVQERGDFPLPGRTSALRLLEALQRVVHGIIEECAGEEEGLLPPGLLEERLLAEMGGTTHQWEEMLQGLLAWGEALREDRRRARRLPRSYVRNVALGLLGWRTLGPPEHVPLARKTPRRELEAAALDASGLAQPIQECHLSIHMSGTLSPLAEYRDTLGLPPESATLTVPSPFPLGNRLLFYSPDVSTRHEELRGDPEAMPRLYAALRAVLKGLPVKTAVFFPSFGLLDRFLGMGLGRDLPEGAVVETRGLSTGELWKLVEGFKAAHGARVLLAVCGGRIAEGIDFPDEELQAVVVVGIPFPAPTARRQALMRYLDLTHGRGWEYCMQAPAQRAILQALGRMIRSENDRGVGVLLDRRAAQFQGVLPGLAPLDPGFPQRAQAFFSGAPHPPSI